MAKQKNKVRVEGLWEPEGILQKAGHWTMDPFEFGEGKGMGAAEKAANIARFMAIQKMFGGVGHLGRFIYNKRMGKLLSPEKAQKKASKFGPTNPEEYDFDPSTGQYYVKNEAYPSGDNPNWEGPFDPNQEALSGQFSEDPMFGQEDASFLEGTGEGESSFDPNADEYGWDDSMGIPPAPPELTNAQMMAANGLPTDTMRLSSGPAPPTIQEGINSLYDPREKAAIFDELRNPFDSPELAAMFAPGADISIDQPFDPYSGFDPGDTLARMGYGGYDEVGAALAARGGGGGGVKGRGVQNR